jgi:hypothetical protein
MAGSKSRPFFSASIAQLEAEFARHRNQANRLRVLLTELGYRHTNRAVELRRRIVEALAALESASPAPVETDSPKPPSGPFRAVHANVSPPQRPPAAPDPRAVSAAPLPAPPISNAPETILDAWTALEVLSPPSFRRPEELVGGERAQVAWLEKDRLPWEGTGEKARRNTKLYYQVVLGTVDLEPAVTRLLACYADTRPERPAARGEAILALVCLNRDGLLVEAPAVAVSSFAWGMPYALRGELSSLSAWSAAERPVIEGLDELLRRARPDDERGRALDLATLLAGWEWLVNRLGVPRELVKPPRFAVRCYEYFKSPNPPEPLLLNSFFLNDLQKAKRLFRQGEATSNLRRYLGCEQPARRLDLLEDSQAVEAAVAPDQIPQARWPGPGRRSLVLLQQAAVNLSVSELNKTGILAVNGPPGTGKTTLLRDLVAAIVAARAEAMAGFDDPATAFLHSGEKLKAGAAWLHLYRLDPRIKGFEMLVASSNNRAVENVSEELPDLNAVAEDATDLRYFRTLSDTLFERDTWGLGAAVLGNAANRGRFKKTFWWDEEFGFATYLAEAAGTPQRVEARRADTGESETRQPRIVEEEKPPRSHEEALRRWRKARSNFQAALTRSREGLAELCEVRRKAVSLAGLAKELAAAEEAHETARGKATAVERECGRASGNLAAVRAELEALARKLAGFDRAAPSLLARLFRTRRARAWRAVRAPVQQALDRVRKAEIEAAKHLAVQQDKQRHAAEDRQTTALVRARAAERYDRVGQQVNAARERLGHGLIDADFFELDHAERHTVVPWLDAQQQRLRDDVFVAAMGLHRAFIDAAAKPLRHNLGALMNVFGGRKLPTAEKQALMLDLWASLFLVVPLVSTTFASVERMLGDLAPEGLGWLLIDEAGQALPQAAVGALLRTRRAVVVGDPAQIEPIVVLPDTLTHAICRHFGVDPDRFNAPAASAQTLADAATPYVAEFQGRLGSRTVGVPLLVHRRCAEPMFGIANAVAYDRLMVQAKPAKPSRIGDVLGPSRWIDVRGTGADKWCPEEGDVVLRLLESLAEQRVEPDLYILSPFVIVAENLRRLVRHAPFLSGWIEDSWNWTSGHVGTVHTAQGREAEAVIFVLGAPAPQQMGARGWAGGRPNLLNVAVTRAKERLYVVGNRGLWREAGLFRELDARLENGGQRVGPGG